MSHVITGSCCNDTLCVSVCPVNCISPTPDSPEFLRSGMLHINPDVCINCGACADACPVSAIVPEDLITKSEKDFIDFNKQYFEVNPDAVNQKVYLPEKKSLDNDFQNNIRVAIIGSGPSAMYAVNALNIAGVKHISVFEKESTIGGLVYSGVAPDRTYTKQMLDLAHRTFKDNRVNLFLNVEVGKDITLEDIKASHDAVIFSTGARADRLLNVPGENLINCYGIRDFAGWYNGVKEFKNKIKTLDGPRVAVVGHGNTAVDAARFLISDMPFLNNVHMPSDIKKKLLDSDIREVVLIGRNNPNGPAFSRSGLHELKSVPGFKIVIDKDSVFPETKKNLALNWILDEFPQEKIDYSKKLTAKSERRVIIRFGMEITEITGKDNVEGIIGKDVNGLEVKIPVKTVIRSIGYRNLPIQNIPFDFEKNMVPNDEGVIVNNSQEKPGFYVTGWLKRGTIGGIGHNKSDSLNTVNTIISHANSNLLPKPYVSFNALVNQIQQTIPTAHIIKNKFERSTTLSAVR